MNSLLESEKPPSLTVVICVWLCRNCHSRESGNLFSVMLSMLINQMAVKEILLIGNPTLRENLEDVIIFNEELDNLIKDLKDTLIDFQKRKKISIGITASQIGVLKKVIYLNLPKRSFALVNPEINWESDERYK